MEIAKQGKELRQLSKLSFDRAVKFWYWAILIEIIAGVTALIMSILATSLGWNIFFAILAFTLLATSYYLKIRFEAVYDAAETMRRQSVFTEALGWPISSTQFSEWRLKAGIKMLAKLEQTGVDENYYATKEGMGPRRLLLMSQESAFWTRHLYEYLSLWVWITFIVSLVLFAAVITLTSTDFFQRTVALKIVYAVYLLMPLVLSVDVLRWALRLGRLKKSIRQIEDNFETLENGTELKVEEVLRLVAEYNCQVVAGFPTPTWFFRCYAKQITKLWEKASR